MGGDGEKQSRQRTWDRTLLTLNKAVRKGLAEGGDREPAGSLREEH